MKVISPYQAPEAHYDNVNGRPGKLGSPDYRVSSFVLDTEADYYITDIVRKAYRIKLDRSDVINAAIKYFVKKEGLDDLLGCTLAEMYEKLNLVIEYADKPANQNVLDGIRRRRDKKQPRLPRRKK